MLDIIPSELDDHDSHIDSKKGDARSQDISNNDIYTVLN